MAGAAGHRTRTVGSTMRELPVPDPGTPSTRTPTGYRWWLVRVQAPSVTGGVLLGIVWSLSQALMPAAIGKAIDLGIVARNPGALVLWTGALLLLGATQAIAGIMRHRRVVANWLGSAYR